MSVASAASLLAKSYNPKQILSWIKNGQLATGTHFNSEWIQGATPAAGSTPGAAAIPDRTTAGALGQQNAGLVSPDTEQRAFLRRYGEGGGGAGVQGMFYLVDRLAHWGGGDGTLNTAQTVSTPSLTRFTSGVGVWAAIEVYTAVGATGTTATISYTNTVPTSGKTSPAIVFGGVGFQNARTVLPFGWASGDLGVTAVASVTLAASTGTAGNFGITLFKTLGIWSFNNTPPYPHGRPPLDSAGPMPVIPDNACLQLLHFGGGQVNSVMTAEIVFFED